MTAIVLMIIGGLLLTIGAALYFSPAKPYKSSNQSDNLIKIINMAIADGVLTANERSLIKQQALEEGLDYNTVIKDVEKQMAELTSDSETQLINVNKKNGDDFEKYIVQKFSKKFFRIKEWAGDKYIKGVYAETTPQPDLLIEFNLKNETTTFSVECKWRQNLYKGGVQFAKEEQFIRYQNFEKDRQIPVFLAIGLGGKASSPEKLFIIPLREITSNFITRKELAKYEKNPGNNFFFDAKAITLK